MRVKTTVAIAILFFAIAAVAAFSANKGGLPTGVKIAKTAVGPTLTDNGMTLYTFANDTSDKSMCNGVCAQNWPPLAASGNAEPMGNWSVITREDGTKQWAYKGKPLYRFAKDMKPGETAGEGFKDLWHVAKP